MNRGFGRKSALAIVFGVELTEWPSGFTLTTRGITLESSASTREAALDEFKTLLVDLMQTGQHYLRQEDQVSGHE